MSNPQHVSRRSDVANWHAVAPAQREGKQCSLQLSTWLAPDSVVATLNASAPAFAPPPSQAQALEALLAAGKPAI